MRILVLGSKGQLGKCLSDKLIDPLDEVFFASHEELDISNFEETKDFFNDLVPNVVINAAGYTAVDKAEEDQEMADLVNHRAIANISNLCSQLDCWLIHISTDYVFDGNSDSFYGESDQTNPQCVYGETKLRGEQAVISSACKFIIIRTAWLYSEYGNNFLKTILRLSYERNELTIVKDEFGCPTYAQDLAEAIFKIIHDLDTKALGGLYHFCGNQKYSWNEFAKEILDYALAIGIIKNEVKILPINSKDYNSLAMRPKNSALDCSKIMQHFNIEPSNCGNGIKKALENYKMNKYE